MIEVASKSKVEIHEACGGRQVCIEVYCIASSNPQNALMTMMGLKSTRRKEGEEDETTMYNKQKKNLQAKENRQIVFQKINAEREESGTPTLISRSVEIVPSRDKKAHEEPY